MFLPIGFAESPLRRLPVVTLGVAALCIVVFIGTMSAQHELTHPDQLEQTLKDFFGYWAEHPYLQLSPELTQRMPGIDDRLGKVREEAKEAGVEPPTPGILSLEQERLREYEKPVLESMRELDRYNALRRWGLVPARGLAQPGWLTHAFLHLGWLHLLGNLFYLLLLGAPLLEDAWGRVLFPIFFVLGAVAAAAMYAALSPGSQTVLVGASGAIAACVGAAVYRFAHRKVRIAFLLNAWRGLSRPGSTFTVPAWLWGVVWFGTELYNLVHYRSSAGIAFAAHVGGFAFGVLFAGVARHSKLEAWVDAPPEARAEDHALVDGLRLARAKAALGQAVDAQQVMAKVLAPLLSESMVPRLRANASELIALHLGGGISHPVAFRLAEVLEGGGGEDWRFALSLYRTGGSMPGPLGQKALLRAVTLRLERRDSLKSAAEDLERLLADPSLPESLRTRALTASSQLASMRGHSLQH